MKLENLLYEIGKSHFYIMHLSYNGRERERLWNYSRKENLIGLDFPGIVKDNWMEIRESVKERLPKRWVKQFDMFCNFADRGMKIGDIVIVLEGWYSLLGIAEIIGDQKYKKELSARRLFFDHVRRVRWIKKYEHAERLTLRHPLKGFNNALSKVKLGTKRWLILTKLPITAGQHVAIKCTYNNGDEGVLVGFNGTCSENIIKWNIEQGRVWCNQKDCECRKFYDRGFKGKKPVDPCYESVLFRDWQYGAGWYHTGSRAGTPMHLSNAEKGRIAVLTTRFPGDPEEDRRIIGFFKIGEVVDNPGEETKLIADRAFAIRLPMEEAKELFFWDYYSTKGGARWGTGLIRYLNDNQVSRILADLGETLRNEKAKRIVNDLLAKDFPKVPPIASGTRIKKSGRRTRRVSIVRKYGSIGEGIEHKKLKKWIAKNPESIGLFNVESTDIEYVFPSGDVADIVFRLTKNRYAIVEIETTNPLPGCYQALKYRVLKCAELGLPITSSNVEAIIVAWSTPQYVRNFATKYGIRFVRKKLATNSSACMQIIN